MLAIVSECLVAALVSAYALSLPYAGWLVWEAGRVRREADAAPRPMRF